MLRLTGGQAGGRPSPPWLYHCPTSSSPSSNKAWPQAAQRGRLLPVHWLEVLVPHCADEAQPGVGAPHCLWAAVTPRRLHARPARHAWRMEPQPSDAHAVVVRHLLQPACAVQGVFVGYLLMRCWPRPKHTASNKQWPPSCRARRSLIAAQHSHSRAPFSSTRLCWIGKRWSG